MILQAKYDFQFTANFQHYLFIGSNTVFSTDPVPSHFLPCSLSVDREPISVSSSLQRQTIYNIHSRAIHKVVLASELFPFYLQRPQGLSARLLLLELHLQERLHLFMDGTQQRLFPGWHSIYTRQWYPQSRFKRYRNSYLQNNRCRY